MKNQYFGDINDYRKYGLLRSILHASRLQLTVGWMLTPDDGSTDGNFTAYLDRPARWSHHDPQLFNVLRESLSSTDERCVQLIEETSLLPSATYFSDIVPDDAPGRRNWFKELLVTSEDAEFIFLDPDNGLEVKSRPYGRKNSSKFLYWREVDALWSAGKSLLIYQHFIREKREKYIQRMLAALEVATPGSLVEAFSTPHVVFLMALQPRHQELHEEIVNTVQPHWGGQIKHWDLLSGSSLV